MKIKMFWGNFFEKQILILEPTIAKNTQPILDIDDIYSGKPRKIELTLRKTKQNEEKKEDSIESPNKLNASQLNQV